LSGFVGTLRVYDRIETDERPFPANWNSLTGRCWLCRALSAAWGNVLLLEHIHVDLHGNSIDRL
jgi:hypothetical protein